MFDQIREFINPGKNPDLVAAREHHREHLPTLWLLGKTGAGKSSLVQAVTGLDSVEVGNGFAPCTMASHAYPFPLDKPVMRFLDTRGLGEAAYDAKEDLEEAGKSSQALVVVMKLDDPEQSAILDALKQIRRSKVIKHLLLVHTGVMQVPESDRARLTEYQRGEVDKVWRGEITSVDVDFECDDGSDYHIPELLDELANLLPVLGLLLDHGEHTELEARNFNQLRTELLWYSGVASASDAFPVVGLVSVPAVQAKMLHSFANQYGVDWDKQTFGELIGTLGSSFAIQYSVRLGTRQLIKLVPGYGQTLGAAAAMAISFGTTYGLGRAACYYFYQKSKGEQVSPRQMQQLYKDAFTKGKKASGYDKD